MADEFQSKKCKTPLEKTTTQHIVNCNYLIPTPISNFPGTVISDQVYNIEKETLYVNPLNRNFTPLKNITSDKYLRVILDNQPLFNQHIE